MFDSRIVPKRATGKAKPSISPIEELHRRCGIYTMPKTVEQILDAVGWTEDADLRNSALLEPSAGDGAFVVEAARRLVLSNKRIGLKSVLSNLRSRIVAFELHAPESRKARRRVIENLVQLGVQRSTAEACARAWIRTGDFLLADLTRLRFTHAVGNPPYVRWSKIPDKLRILYGTRLPREMTHGDLFIPFLDKAIESLEDQGQCGFLCSDRWKFMGFAEAFRKKWLGSLQIRPSPQTSVADSYVRNVDTYPTILIARKKTTARKIARAPGNREAGITLADLGCTIKVGPALGHTPAFILEKGERNVESALRHRWVDSSEIEEGRLVWRGRHLAAPFDKEGNLIDICQYPLLLKRLTRFKLILSARSVVADSAKWYRTIDCIRPSDWDRPKLLVPELAKIPRLAIDYSGAIPSHGVYAIFAPNDDVELIYSKLKNGKLAKALQGIAPLVNGGYTRCYKRFLQQMVFA